MWSAVSSNGAVDEKITICRRCFIRALLLANFWPPYTSFHIPLANRGRHYLNVLRSSIERCPYVRSILARNHDLKDVHFRCSQNRLDSALLVAHLLKVVLLSTRSMKSWSSTAFPFCWPNIKLIQVAISSAIIGVLFWSGLTGSTRV